MKKILGAVAILLICAMVFAQEEPKPGKPTEEEIKALIEALGSDSWKERTQAREKLIEAGAAAGPLLEEAVKSDDPEIAHQANGILDEICYLPEKLKAEVDALFEKLKSRDDKERDGAFRKFTGMGKRVMSYLARLLRVPSDKKVEVTLSVEQTFTQKRQPVDYTVTVKNAGEKPVWVPGPGMPESGAYRLLGSGEKQIQWSRGGNTGGGLFGFVYIAPGESFERRKQFRPYSGYTGRHTLKVRLANAQGVQYTTPGGERHFLPVEHYTLEKEVTAEVIHLPELVEGEKGKASSQLTTGISVGKTGITEGAPIAVKLAIHNGDKKDRKISASLHVGLWYVLLSAGEKKNFVAEGLLLDGKPTPSEDYAIEPGKSLEFDAAIAPQLKAGEYYLVCGYTELRAKNQDTFRGEIISNAVKIKVTPAGKEKEDKSQDF